MEGTAAKWRISSETLHERVPTGWRDSRKRVSEVCMRDPVADGPRNWMLIKLLICKGYSEASPVTWDCLEIYGTERRCRLTYEASTECNLVRDNVGVYCASFIRQSDRTRILDAGFQGFIPKPYTRERLLETILTVLAK